MFSHLVAKASVVLLTLMVFLVASAGSAHAQENDYRKALGLISDKLHRRFPNLRGSVVAMKGADLYLSLGEKDKVVKGVKLNVYRTGAAFRHPTTGVVLGALEEEIGEVESRGRAGEILHCPPGPAQAGHGTLSARQGHGAHVRRENSPGDTAFRQPDERVLQHGRRSRGNLDANSLKSGRFDVYDADRLQVWLLETRHRRR